MPQGSVIPVMPLAENIHALVNQHFEAIGASNVRDLHQMMLDLIEAPMLETVMESCHYKQSKAAKILGLSRATCRSMLIKHFDEKYCSERKQKDL